MTKGEIIRKYRKSNKLTQKELGSYIKVSSKYVSNIENNRKTVPLKLIKLIKDKFNATNKDIKILERPDKDSNNYIEIEKKKLRKLELELNKREKEILSRQFKVNTSDSSLMLKVNIREELIKINSLLEKDISILESHMVFADSSLIKYFNGSLNLTINKLNKAIHTLEKIRDKDKDKNIIDIY